MNSVSKENIAFKYTLYFLCSLIFGLFIFAFLEYKGNKSTYILFTIISNTLLFYGFRKNAIFFDTFIGIFLWLGFWLKLTIRVAFIEGLFNEPVGQFDGSGAAFDHALLVASCGQLGMLAASFFREKYLFNYPDKMSDVGLKGLYKYYKIHRSLFLSGFVVLFVTIAVTNIYFGIYQRGTIPQTVLPYGLSGIYKWLLLFGCASISALILKFELTLNKKVSNSIALLCLMESFFNNLSLLSRGMVINISALIFGVIRNIKLSNMHLNYRSLVIQFLMFVMLVISSVYLANYFRVYSFYGFSSTCTSTSTSTSKGIIQDFYNYLERNTRTTKLAFIDRWVGMEAVMAVSSYPGKGWGFWSEAWKEKFMYNKLTFYDEYLVDSQYKNAGQTKYHSISLPGILAFCFYPGSFSFLFVCMFMLGLIGAVIEISAYRLGERNVILCSLLAMVVAYRYAHFGYVPGQSYLLFGALYLNLFIINISNKIFLYWYDLKNVGGLVNDESNR